MRRVYLVSSSNSAMSSNSSETQSVEENNKVSDVEVSESIDIQNRLLKSWKRMKELGANQGEEKDAETKRPPWRVVSVSKLPKPDKNALLKAKLLDASRRLRAGRSSIGLQTNIESTRFFTDVNIGIQTDLFLSKDIGILTDGSYAKKTDIGHEYILTYSVSQMTDQRKLSDAATQTLLPKLPGYIFLNSYLARDWSTKYINNLGEIEKEVMRQTSVLQNAESITRPNSKFCISPSAIGLGGDRITKPGMDGIKRNLLQHTHLSWNFDYGDVDDNTNTRNCVPYIVVANRPWHSFAHLKPATTGDEFSNIEHAPYNFNIFLLSIDELIYETNRLIDIIEENLSTTKLCCKSLFNTYVKQNEISSPSDKWLPLIEKDEKLLAEMVKSFTENVKRI